MDHALAAQRLSSLLSLQHPPVALAFVDQAPEGLALPDRPVPSACAFWRLAEQRTFYAPAEQHFNCPVGSMVMGFELPQEIAEQLNGLVASMCTAGYLDADEPANIPAVARRSAGIVYGPLREFPVEPDVVLLWVNVAQAMLYSEAAGRAAWTNSPMTVTGRPGCAALPVALRDRRPGMSLGCVGMRTFTEISDDLNLAVIPFGALDSFVDAVAKTAESNSAMRSFYVSRKAAIASSVHDA